jgi:carbonic anhydrase
MITKNPRIGTRSPRSALLFINALVVLLLCAAGPQPFAAENNTACDPETPWGYDGYKGPLYWGTECAPKKVAHATPTPSQMPSALTNVTPTPTPTEPDQSYAVCLDGVTQSPVSGTTLNTEETLAQVPITPANATAKVTNNGHAIELGSLEKGGQPIEGNTELSFNGTTYKLKQLHFHCPSEHRRWANGTYQPFNPMEMHLVHESDSGTIAVVGVFFSAGADNKELQTVLDSVDSGQNTTVDISALLPAANSRSAWFYYGSLTTPSCDQVVNWFVMKQPITASSVQISAFQKYYSNNSRGASFEKVDGGLKWISVGESGVWGVNSGGTVYFRVGIDADNLRGTGWTSRWSGYSQVSSGRHGVWLVSAKYVVSFASPESSASPTPIPSPTPNITQVSAGRYGVWARDTSGGVFYRVGVNDAKPMGDKWARLTTPYKMGDISSGDFGVWAVEQYPKNNLYFLRDSMTGTLEKPAGSIFSKVDSNISRVSSGFLGVWALGTGGSVSQAIKSRSGITAENPTGAGWRIQDGLLNEITNGKDGVWGTAKTSSTSPDPTLIYFLSSPPTK